MALILFSPNNMTTNTAPTPFVASGSTGYGFVFRLFNGEVSLECTTAFPTWWKLYIGTTPRILAQYKLTGAGSATYTPKDWTIEGSNDNSAWTTVDTVVGSTGWGASEERTFTPDVMTTAYKYFRINITATNGAVSLTTGKELKYYYDDAPAGGSAVPVFESQYRRRVA